MIHLQQALAQHWHLSAASYLHLRLMCTIALGPLVGVLCLLLFHKRRAAGVGASRIRRQVRLLNRYSTVRPLLRPSVNRG
jgi:hypothetical protein